MALISSFFSSIKGKALSLKIGQLGLAGTTGVFALLLGFNHSEEYRMAQHLIQGDYGVESPLPPSFELKYCQHGHNLSIIEKSFESHMNFIGLVGLQCTGKTSTLKYEAYKYKAHSIYCNLDLDNNFTNLMEILYNHMYKGIYKLPWFLRHVRLNADLTHEDIVRSVLRKVVSDPKNTNTKRIRLFIDVNSDDHPSQSLLTGKLPSSELMEGRVQRFKAESLVRDIKRLVQDDNLIHCMFASSDEGLWFQREAEREGRLKLFHFKELSLSLSTQYVLDKYGCSDQDMNAWLKHFPRRFDTLMDFGETPKKDAYCKQALANQVVLVKKSITTSPRQTWLQWLSGESKRDPRTLYRIALTRDLDICDIVDRGRMSEEQFIKEFVVNNIYCPGSTMGTFTLQFDATRDAVKKVVAKSFLL
jgi:hypothetical protein